MAGVDRETCAIGGGVMTSAASIDILTPAVRACCATCDLCGFRDTDDEPLRFCQRDGMVVDDHQHCSAYVALLPPSPASVRSLAECRPSLVDKPLLGVSSLDLSAGTSVPATFAGG